ncbi:hypothetical protein, partial [Pseudomonas sp. FW305-70]|uniref:hypothetical protein n=1 Tax=Pseudomonas sp. FW305-70 TaxID=2751342 RepID=UPI000CB8594F
IQLSPSDLVHPRIAANVASRVLVILLVVCVHSTFLEHFRINSTVEKPAFIEERDLLLGVA